MQLWVDPGTFLAAGPDMLDPNFMHTVVLVCQHTAEGAYGLVVNRPSEYTTRKILPQHPPARPARPAGVRRRAGRAREPADPAPRAQAIPGGLELAEGLWIGGELDSLVRHLASGPAAARDVRLFLGYSGLGRRAARRSS